MLLLHKLRAAGHLLGCLLWYNLCSAAGGLARGPVSALREAWRATWRLSLAVGAGLRLRGTHRVRRLAELARASGAPSAVLNANPEVAFATAVGLNQLQRFDETVALITPLLRPTKELAKLYGIRGVAQAELGRYPEALADLGECARLRPAVMRSHNLNIIRAFFLAARGDTRAAREVWADQLFQTGYPGTAGAAIAGHIAWHLQRYLEPLKLHGSVGVFVGYYPNAVGHAVLDPFHLVQLFRDRFDHLVILRGPGEVYHPATRLAAEVIGQFVNQIELDHPQLLTFAWHGLGELRHRNLTFLLHNYWSLNRLAYRARTDPSHPMSRERSYFAPPPKVIHQAESLCRRIGIDPTRPLVVVHTREHGYHKLGVQRFRNTNARNYVPALRRLIDRGFQVVRVGDEKMTRVGREVPGLIELPFVRGYHPVLDVYLIWRCRFMISCQSGPCSYARAFGKPNLVLNAVYHHTLLPEHNELIAFKTYRAAKTGRPLGVEELFRAGAHLLDRTCHFEEAGMELEEMTPDEILAATDEMLEWLDDPTRTETPAQKRFRRLMAWHSAHPNRDHPLSHALSDYVGYSLPECRVSDAVCRMRPGYLEDDGAPGRRLAGAGTRVS
jgi:putative glycosyltransferase (TIGR04372 family)